ncbi:MAG: hypothetical protein AB1733_24055 [Thermodesulfobacteriota bacterium]
MAGGEPIILAHRTSLGLLEGYQSKNAAELRRDEINANAFSNELDL